MFVRLINERTRTRFYVRLVKRTNTNTVLVRSIAFVNIRSLMFVNCSLVYVRERFVYVRSYMIVYVRSYN